MNPEIILDDLQKSLSAINERFRKPKEKIVQILKQTKPEQTKQNVYAGPSWYPEEKIVYAIKQAEAEELETTLNSLSNNQVEEVLKAVCKQPSMNRDYWYKYPTGIFI